MVILAIGILSIFNLPEVEAAGVSNTTYAPASYAVTMFTQASYGLTVANGSTTNTSLVWFVVPKNSTGINENYSFWYSAVASATVDCAGSTVAWTSIGTNNSYVAINASGNATKSWTVPATDSWYCINITVGAWNEDVTANYTLTRLLELDDTPINVYLNWTSSLFDGTDTLYVYTDDSASACYYGYADSDTSSDFIIAFSNNSIKNPFATITNVSDGQKIYFMCRDDHYNWEVSSHAVRAMGEDDEENGGQIIIDQTFVQQNKKRIAFIVVGIIVAIGFIMLFGMGKKRRR